MEAPRHSGSCQYGRSTDWAIGIAWKAIGWFATADRDRGLPPSRMPNQSGLWRPFEAGRHQSVAIDTTGIRHFC
jgi:hypothetical protein